MGVAVGAGEVMGGVRHFHRVLEGDLDTVEPGWNEWARERVPSIPSEAIILLEREGELPLAEPEPESHDGSETVKRATAWLAEVSKILVRKNRKYGDSAANPMRIFSRASSVEQLLVRIDDKLSRIARGDGLLDTDEDVLRDLVGYLALLAAMKTDKQEK